MGHTAASCRETGHEYHIVRANYYKMNGQTTGLGTPAYDHTITYSMLYCRKCGDTKEIIVSDSPKSKI